MVREITPLSKLNRVSLAVDKKKITEKAEKDLDVSLNNARVSAILLKKKTNMGKLRNDEGNRATIL